jgi:four helix bundle protein
MATLRYARSFEELIVYQKASAVAARIFDLSKSFPKEEAYSLTDQIRRASRSIGAQIAEAWGKRRYPRHFVSKLTDAEAEHLETRHWIRVAASCGYLTKEQERDFVDELTEIGRMLHAMMGKAKAFCGPFDPVAREEAAEYFASA